MMNTLQDRIEFAFSALAREDRKKSKLAEHCKIAPSSVNDWFTGKTKSIKAEVLEQAAEYLQVREKWLITGKGPYQRIQFQISSQTPQNPPVPLLGYEQVLGYLTQGVDCLPSNVSQLQTQITLSERSYAVQIQGDSMNPEFKESDVVIFDSELQPLPGDYVLAQAPGQVVAFKQYRLISRGGKDIFELAPLNLNFPSLRSNELELSVIGVMVEHRKYNIRRQANS